MGTTLFNSSCCVPGVSASAAGAEAVAASAKDGENSRVRGSGTRTVTSASAPQRLAPATRFGFGLFPVSSSFHNVQPNNLF